MTEACLFFHTKAFFLCIMLCWLERMMIRADVACQPSSQPIRWLPPPMLASHWLKAHLGLQGHCTQRLEPALYCVGFLLYCTVALRFIATFAHHCNKSCGSEGLWCGGTLRGECLKLLQTSLHCIALHCFALLCLAYPALHGKALAQVNICVSSPFTKLSDITDTIHSRGRSIVWILRVPFKTQKM